MFYFEDRTPKEIAVSLLRYFRDSWDMVKEVIMSDSHHTDGEKATPMTAGFTILHKAYKL